MSEQDGFFGLDNKEAAQGNRFKKWEPVKGKKYIVGILAEDRAQAFCGFKTHFKDRKFRCKSTNLKKEICCTHGYDGAEAKFSIGTIIAVYEVNSENKIIGREVTPWFFNSIVYNQIIQALEDFPTDGPMNDLKITWDDPRMMRCSINASPKSIWSQNEEFKQNVLAEARPMWDALPNRIAKNLSIPEIAELLGIDDGTGAGDTASDMDLSDLASSLDA
jgi:hypothetical protein